MRHDDTDLEGLGELLELHNFAAEIGGGFWVSFKVQVCVPDEGRPHGISYALTLHRFGGERLMGYDNAHKPDIGSGPSKRPKKRKLRHDHRHWRSKVSAYEFVSPRQLLIDFWDDVYRLLKEEGVP